MTCLRWALRCAVGVVLCLGLSGCFPPADNPSDEKKEPHYLAGKNLVSQMDWQGAIGEFEKALEVNPQSASAHFELGWLYEEKMNPPDPAAAIYHYNRYLNSSANPDKADLVRQHINTCKLELVKGLAVGPVPSAAQREMDRLAAENKDLQGQVAQLQAQIAQLKTAAAAASAAAAATPVRVPNSGDAVAQNPPPHSTFSRSSIESPKAESSHSYTGTTTRFSNAGAGRTHTIKPRETMASIAREYGVSLEALEAANPRVRPTHLLVGQTLKIP